MSEKQCPNKAIGTVEGVERTYTWVIDDLVVNLSKGKLTSPKFTLKLDNRETKFSTKWYIELLSTTLAENKKCMAIQVGCTHDINPKTTIDITILDSSNDEVFRCASSDMDLTICNPLFFCFVPMEKLKNEKVSSNGSNKTTLVFAFAGTEYFKIKRNSICKERSQINCLNSFAQLANNKQFSDVILDVKGEELYAYKGILASRSAVFMAMFSHDTTEKDCSRVLIKDVSYSTMYDLLQYIYTDSEPQFICDEAQGKCKNLLIAADKYGLERLKYRMEEKLVLDIQVTNVFEYLNFADTYNAEHLKEEAIEFIMSHRNEIAESEVYKKFIDLHPNVSCEVFRSLLIKKRKLE